MHFATKAIHVGQEPEPITGAVIPPVFLTSTYALERPEETKGYDYTRHGNPNFENLEKTLAALEEAEHATVFSSGMGAITALTSLLSQGDRVVAIDGLYGGTFRLFTDVFQRFGITFLRLETADLEQLERALQPPTKMLLFETPSNPLLYVVDIAAVSALAKKLHVMTVVDSTFASPYFQKPLALGADVVWHSTTKYIGGHSDLIGGAMLTNDKKLKDEIDGARVSLGVNPSPFDVWLASRGVKTLALRMEQHTKNAQALAEFLEGHPKVRKVYYPGLKSHETHNIACRQMSGFGGMLSVDFALSFEETKKVISSLKLFALAVSLGGVESLINHSASMSHAPVPKKEREKMGITDTLVRISAGIEATEDLLADFKASMK